MSVTVNGLTNRINSGGYTYDNNGNMTSSGTFDVENRLTTASGEAYGYLTNNQRVYKRDAIGNEWIYFHDVTGKRIMTFQMMNSGGTLVVAGGSKNVSFAGRSIILNDAPVVTERLGSVVSRAGAAVDYFPYGEEKVTTSNPAEKFGTYLRDANGLDYADQRYFNSPAGRFLSGDPYQASGGAGNPKSWNRYSYVEGDPANLRDQRGLESEDPDDPGNEMIFCPALGTTVPRKLCPKGGYEGDEGGPYCNPGPGCVETYGETGNPIKVTDFTNSGLQYDGIARVLEDILQGLSSDQDCANWLKGGGDLIRVLVDNRSFGVGTLNVNSVAAFVGITNLDGSATGAPITAAFTVSRNGAFFSKKDAYGNNFSVGWRNYSGGSAQAQGAILIHELAHILGASGFLPDFNKPDAGKSNDKLVDKNCGKIIEAKMIKIGKTLRLCFLFLCVNGLVAQEDPILNEMIKPLYFEAMSYPLAAKVTHTEGTVVIWVKLNSEGNVILSRAISGAKNLIPETLENSKKWRFQPNKIMAAIIVYRFRFQGLCNLPCPSQFRFEPPNSATISVGTPVVTI